MSTIRDPAYITNAGRTMMTAGGEVTYTKAVLYGQDISGLSDSQIKALISLGNPLREVKIGVSDKQSSDSGSTVILEAVFQNNDLKADLQYKAVGFFARKNDVEQLVIVAVANSGAYLAATNPDGVATDALDLKIAVKIGDATSVTAVVDPAGSVTPATLNGAINKATHDLTAKIDTKADKATVDEEIGKIDFSPYARIVDVYSKTDANKLLDAKADKTALNSYDTITDVDSKIKTVTDLANTKVDATYSYSKAELDKKLLALSTDTSGKVNADQVATMIADKADKTYVDNQIATIDFGKIKFRKQYVNSDGQTADKTWSATKNKDGTYTIDLWQDDQTASKLSGVLVQLPSKADTSTVNAQIADAKNTAQSNLDKVKSDLNGAINTKANSDDVYNRPTIDSAFNTRDNNINRAQSTADGAQTTANNALPKAGGNMTLRSTINWNGGGINDKTGNLGGLNWSGGTDTASIYGDQNNNDNLDLAFDLGDDSSNHFSFRNNGSEVAAIYSNGHFSGTVDWSNVSGRPDVATNANVTQLQNSKLNFKYITDGYDLLSADGFWGVMEANNAQNLKNLPNGMNNKTWMYVLKLVKDGFGTVIIFDQDNCIWVNNKNGDVWNGWASYAHQSDVTALQNIINQQNQTIQSLTTRLTNAENEIRYIKANYVEGRRFPAIQEAQANSWENENPQRIAFIER